VCVYIGVKNYVISWSEEYDVFDSISIFAVALGLWGRELVWFGFNVMLFLAFSV